MPSSTVAGASFLGVDGTKDSQEVALGILNYTSHKISITTETVCRNGTHIRRGPSRLDLLPLLRRSWRQWCMEKAGRRRGIAIGERLRSGLRGNAIDQAARSRWGLCTNFAGGAAW